MTPSKSDLEKLRVKMRRVYELFDVPRLDLTAADVPRVVVILGSSRSGSSLLFHLLSQSGGFWTLHGEETPFYRANGFGWVTYKDHSDALRPTIDSDARDSVFEHLVQDLGRNPAAGMDKSYLAQSAVRILLQWPQLDFDPERVVEAVRGAAARATDAVTLWMNLTLTLGLEPGFYDLPGPKSRNLQLEVPDYVLEEPPYIIPSPRELPTREGLRQAPLLLKTSTNAYRLNWLKVLFPHSEFRFIVLGRNPAASINGLMDGWLSNAFHAHNLQFVQPLSIRGYSDTIAFGDRWWKFDLPPGWNDYDDAPLSEVCAFQWRSAYKHILAGVKDQTALHIKFEDLLSAPHSAATLQSVFDFCGTRAIRPVDALRTRPVMASQEPKPARWRAREDEIWPRLEHKEVQEIARRLGYDLSSPDGLL